MIVSITQSLFFHLSFTKFELVILLEVVPW